MTETLLMLISTALVNNFLLHWPLGVDPLLQGSHDPLADRRQVHALGIATTCLMLLNGLLGYVAYHWLLVPLGLAALHLFVFLALARNKIYSVYPGKNTSHNYYLYDIYI